MYQRRLDVKVLPILAHLESAAAGPQRLPHARRTRRLGVEPCPEEVEPQLPVGAMPRYPSQTAMKMAAYAMELGLKLWSSTP